MGAKNGHDGVVKLLLEREDVDPDRPDKQASTPLSWAAGNGYEGLSSCCWNGKMSNPIGQISNTAHHSRGRLITDMKGLSSYY